MSKTSNFSGPRIGAISKYPKTLVHPNYTPAVISTGAIPGASARLPPVIVNNEDQEEYHRAPGLRFEQTCEHTDAPARYCRIRDSRCGSL
jgi:hypothetical protein